MSLTGCRATDDLFCSGAGCEWTTEEWKRLSALAGLPDPPEDLSNRYWNDPAAAALGQEFYFDPRFSGNANLLDAIGNPVPYARAASGQPINVSCATCHDPRRAGSDFTSAPNTVSIGAGWYDVNSEQTVNAAYYPLLYWNGRSDSLWSQAAAVTESGVSVNGSRLNTFWVIYNDPHYHAAYDALFDPKLPETPPSTADVPLTGKPVAAPAVNANWNATSAANREMVTRVHVNFAKAIAAYEYRLLSRNSLFDRFVAGEVTAISPAAKRGARLFVGKASCVDCHNGPLFSDGTFHDIGVPQTGDHVPTVTDCYPGRASCDCTPGAEKGNCFPAGAWSGLLRLAGSVDGTDANGDLVVNFNNFRRDSMWSDDPGDTSRQPFYAAPTDPTLKGAWRTPSLRDVALTPPYMHDGYYQTLEDVVWHYNVGGTASGHGQFVLPVCEPGVESDPAGGNACMAADAPVPARAAQIKPLGLTDGELSDLVEFLKTLTGERLPASLISKPVPPSDGGAPDSGTPDGGTPDSGTPDGGTPGDGGTTATFGGSQ